MTGQTSARRPAKVPSKVKDKQLLEVMKQYCKKVTTETTGKNSTKSRPGQAGLTQCQLTGDWWLYNDILTPPHGTE